MKKIFCVSEIILNKVVHNVLVCKDPAVINESMQYMTEYMLFMYSVCLSVCS